MCKAIRENNNFNDFGMYSQRILMLTKFKSIIASEMINENNVLIINRKQVILVFWNFIITNSFLKMSLIN